MAAIYQWFVEGEVILTTTLYPAEEQEALEFSIDIDSGRLGAVYGDSSEVSGISANNGTLVLIRFDLDIGEDASDVVSIVAENGDLVLIRFDLDIGEDASDVTGINAEDGTLETVRIDGYMPENGIDLVVNLDSSYCEMV